MTGAPTIRLLLVDARALMRAALGGLLQTRPEFRLLGDAGTITEALALAAELRPDVFVLSPQPGDGLGLDAIPRLLAAAGPAARLLLIAGVTDPDLHRQAMRLGASGSVTLDRSAETLFKAIEKVHQGELWMERRMMTDFLGPQAAAGHHERERIDSLTAREHEVVTLICEGLRNKQIAERLMVSDVTVRHHLTSIFSKLQVTDRLGLLLYATRHGLAASPRQDQPH